MGQKINPNGFRLGITTDHRSKWYADSSKPGQRYADYVGEDIKIRQLLSTGLERAGISRVNIGRGADAQKTTDNTAAAAPAAEAGSEG
jgi:small subunit ribosomal protein S3